MWKKLGTIDRRIIFVVTALSVLIPLLTQVIMKIRVSTPVQDAYNAVQKLAPGSVVFISIDYDPSGQPELQPMLLAVLRHCFSKNLKVVMMGHLALGVPLGEIGLEQVAHEYNKEYGIDYCNIGYRPGFQALMIGMGKEIRDYFASDFFGTPIDSLPIMRSIHNYDNIDLLVTLAYGEVADYWVRIANARFGQKIVCGGTAVMAPGWYPYLQANQIEGLIGGLKGAAEYETLVKHPGTATVGMTAQSAAHTLIVFFIIIANLAYFATRKRR